MTINSYNEVHVCRDHNSIENLFLNISFISKAIKNVFGRYLKKFRVWNYIIFSVTFSVFWVQNRLGKTIAIYKGYTFYCDPRQKTTNQWVCTKAGHAKCRARFITTKEGYLLRTSNLVHQHLPPRFTIHNGVYLKLWKQKM